jgi:O-antigen/teichoic acid export membrane protein
MLNKIFGTLGSKVLISVCNFAILILTTQYLGAEGRGYISLLITNLTLIQLINQIISGPAYVYLVPRKPIEQLLLPGYAWAVISAIITTLALLALGQIPLEWQWHHILLSILYSVFSMHLMILLGKEKVNAYNFLQLWEVLVILGFTASLFLSAHIELDVYLWALYAAYISSLLLSLWFVRKLLRFNLNFKLKESIQAIFKYGFTAQLSNIITFLNYRLSYYFLYFFLNVDDLGKYAAGIALAEGIWIISKSFALVQYSKLVNVDHKEQASKITNSNIVLIFWLTITAILIALLIPKSIYLFILGDEFGKAKDVITYISPGILLFAISAPIASYFSGNGQFSINNKAALFGLLINVITGLLLIPRYEIIGAAISASIVYAFILLFQLYQYQKQQSLGNIKWLQPWKSLDDLK